MPAVLLTKYRLSVTQFFRFLIYQKGDVLSTASIRFGEQKLLKPCTVFRKASAVIAITL